MTLAILFGALAGFGVYALIRVWLRPRPGLAAMIHRIDAGTRSMSTRTVTTLEAERIEAAAPGPVQRLADRLEVLAVDRGWRLGRTRTDLAMMGQSMGGFLANKVLIALGLFLVAPVIWSALSLLGAHIPAQLPALVALLLGAVGFFIPDLNLRSEAEKRRTDFRRVVGVFLDLVAMNLAGGRGLPEALLTASTISDHWALVRIRQALANARLFGTTPWAALGDLGRDIGVDELRDLSAALTLAADDGAKIRASLSARAATMRRRDLADVEGEAGEKSQSMLVAQLLVCAAFMIFLAYPAVASLSAQ
ncbi:MAG: type II secretion system F family protein [Jatrophihabitans sp.]|uniref:type II secretion system F family protein n=1 Tax=Jatrophihabitans sp. TaxID=1932789 RepID=UPI003F823D2B